MLYIALKSLQSINETYFSRLTKSASIDVSEYSEKISTLIRRYYLDGDREVWPSVRELISSSFFVNALELIQNHLQSIADISVNVDTTVASATKLECLGYIYSIITSHVPQHLRLKSEADPADNMTQYFSGIHRLKWVKSLTNCASNVRLFQVAHAVLQLLFTLVQSTRFLPLQFFHSRQLVFSLIYNVRYNGDGISVFIHPCSALAISGYRIYRDGFAGCSAHLANIRGCSAAYRGRFHIFISCSRRFRRALKVISEIRDFLAHFRRFTKFEHCIHQSSFYHG